MGGEGVLATVLEQAGFRDVEVRKVDSPVRLPTATECVRFERESFGALHQMMASLSDDERMPGVGEHDLYAAVLEVPDPRQP